VLNNRTDVYSMLLGNSQRANGLERWLSRDWLSMESVPRPLLCNHSVNTFQQYRLYFLRGRCGGYITTVINRSGFGFFK
jgi:hypothetical protein